MMSSGSPKISGESRMQELAIHHSCKALIDGINSRFPTLHAPAMALSQVVWSMDFYESFVCFHVDRSKCFVGSQTSNDGVSFNAQDFRHHRADGNLFAARCRATPL